MNVSTSLTPALGFALAVLSLIFMYPYARMLVTTADRLLVAATTLALSVGTLSIIVLWLGILNVPILWGVPVGIAAALYVLGRGYLWHPPQATKSAPHSMPLTMHLSRLIIVVIGMLILFNAVYWPFAIDDSVTIYAFWGEQIALTGLLPRGVLYEAYPQLVQTVYAVIFQASGQINEYAAALLPAALSVGAMGAAYLLGRELFSSSVGLLAALLMALTPAYANWASAGYVDLPMSFFYAMTAVFLIRWENHQRWQDALLTGIMAGLAVWTKNSALVLIPTLGVWSAYQIWRLRRLPDLRLVALFAAALIAIGAPWYLRNLYVAGLIVPPTGWTDKAIHTLTTLLPYLTDRPHFPIGIVLTAGLVFTLVCLLRTRGQDHASALLLICYLPFFAAWWLFASYDVRFLFGVLPLAAVMGAYALHALLRWLDGFAWFAAFSRHSAGRIISIAGLLALAALPIFTAVDFKTELLHNPFPTDAEKHRIVHGARYDIAQWINANTPAGAVIWTQDLLLPFLIDDRRAISGGLPTSAQQFAGYDFWLLSPSDQLPTWFADAFTSTQPLHEVGGYRLYPLIPR